MRALSRSRSRRQSSSGAPLPGMAEDAEVAAWWFGCLPFRVAQAQLTGRLTARRCSSYHQEARWRSARQPHRAVLEYRLSARRGRFQLKPAARDDENAAAGILPIWWVAGV